MADVEKKEIIIDINVPYKDAVNGIVKLQDEIEKLRLERSKWAADLKDSSISDEGIKKAQKQVELYDAEIRQLKKTQKEYRSEIDSNLQKEEANAGSLKEMRAQLKLLIKEYDSLSQVDREQIGGVGEQKLLEIRKLQEELKQAEEASGRFQRSVGSYEDAIRRALDGTTPVGKALKEIVNEMKTMSAQVKFVEKDIERQTAALQELGRTVGVDSEEYKKLAAQLAEQQKIYDETTAKIEEMSKTAGDLDDVVGDVNTSFKNFGKDNANIKAANQGAQLLLNGYTALKAGMTLLGVESEELINVFAKIQILQQGLNAINEIANMLEKQSLLYQQAKVIWTNLTTKSINTLVAAKKKDIKTTLEETTANNLLTKSEITTSGAAKVLTVALKGVKKAVMSLPLIGWLVAAVAAVGGLIAVIAKANKEQNKSLELKKAELEYTNKMKDARQQATDEVIKSKVQLEANVRMLKKCEEGSVEWKKKVGEVAGQLGVTEGWLQKNLDKMDDLIQAWVVMAKTQALAQAYVDQLTKSQMQLNSMDYNSITKIMDSVGDNDVTKWAAALVKELGIAKETAQAIANAYNVVINSKGPAVNRAKFNIEALLDTVKKQIQGNIDNASNQIDVLYEQLAGQQKDYSDLVGDGIAGAGKEATDTADKTGEEITKKAKQLAEDLEDLMVEGMADSLEKQVKQIRLAADRWIQSMKEAREKDLDNKELYDRLIEEKERQTQKKIQEIRDNGYKQIAQQIKSINESYSSVIEESKSNTLSKFIQDMRNGVYDIKKKFDEIQAQVNQVARDSRSAISDLQSNLLKIVDDVGVDQIAVNLTENGFSEEDAKEIAAHIKEKLEEAFILNEPEIVLSKKKIDGKIQRTTADIKSVFGFIGKNLKDFEKIKFLDKMFSTFGKIESLENGIAKAEEKIAGANTEILVTSRKINEEYAKTAKTVQEQLLQQAESGTLGNVPNTFEVYIEYNIEDLETKLAEAKDKLTKIFDTDSSEYKATQKEIENITLELQKQYEVLENVRSTERYAVIHFKIEGLEEQLEEAKNRLSTLDEGSDEYNATSSEIERINKELQTQLNLLNAIKDANKFAEREFQLSTGEGLGFFDSTELMEQQLLIEKLQAQIDALNASKEQGMVIEQQVAEKEAEYNQLLIDYTNNSAMWDDAEKERSEEELERRKTEIEQLRAEMAALGYTGADEMDKLIAMLMGKMSKASKDIKNIWAQNASVVLQSFQKVTNAFQELISTVGEDNAELTNFLEAIGYVNIMLNMAVGISEAVASGAGQPFPYNLAAIAAGVAAVVAGIASAISLYKQNHKNVSSPKFAEGGVIGGRTARTKSEGRRDDIPILASKGEYIINAEAVKKYGIDFFDEINFGKKLKKLNLTGRYADGGVVTQTVVQQANNQTIDYSGLVDALQQMPNPVVSVSEINAKQRRVQVKENISKNK